MKKKLLSNEDTLKALIEDVSIEDDDEGTTITILSAFDNDSNKVELTKKRIELRKKIIKIEKKIEKDNKELERIRNQLEKL